MRTWQLAGALGDLRPAGLVRYRYDEVRPTDYLAGWISHLFLCAAAPDGCPVCRPPGTRATAATAWRPCDESTARAHLGRADRPLPTWPVGAAALLPEKRLGLHQRNSLAAARPLDNNRNAAWGESRRSGIPAWRCRGVAEPLDWNDFEHCAQTVFAPLLDYLEDPRR
jgi:exodeoxyribonuclease V gamma subunit